MKSNFFKIIYSFNTPEASKDFIQLRLENKKTIKNINKTEFGFHKKSQAQFFVGLASEVGDEKSFDLKTFV